MDTHNQAKADTHAPVDSLGRDLVPRPKRTVSVLMLGRLWYENTDTICRIRNFSPHGMRIDTVSPLEEHDRVAIEARSEVRFEGRVVWTSRGASGIQFAQAVDYDKLLAGLTTGPGSAPAARGPRFRTMTTARMVIEGRHSVVHVIDASLGGCAIESDTLPQDNTEGRITIPGLPPLEFFTRWASDESAGLAFRQRLDFADLARWIENPELRFAADPRRARDGRTGTPLIRHQSF